MPRNPLRTGVPWDVQARFANLPAAPLSERIPLEERAPLTRLIYPPRIEKLPESVDFNVQDYAMTLNASSTVVSTALAFNLPEGMVGWLQQFSLYVLTPTTDTSVQWAIRINRGPVPGWNNIQNSPGVANLYRENHNDLRVRLPSGCRVDVLISNLNANGPWTVGGKLAGWFHPQQAELARFGADY